MKLILLPLVIWLCGFTRIAVGQQNIQFIYIGSHPLSHEDVLITTTGFRGDYLQGKDSRLTKIYYTNQRAFDTLKSYISRSNWIKRSDSSLPENGEINTAKSIYAFKIIGADANPLYIRGRDCFELFRSTSDYLGLVGLFNTPAYNAISHLRIQCQEQFFYRNSPIRPTRQIDTFRILDTPGIKVKLNN
jgi:hypothetical protein